MRNGLVGILAPTLVAGMAFNSGCTTSDQALLGTVIAAAAGQQGNVGGQILGNGIAHIQSEQAAAEKIAAGNGRQQTINYVTTNQMVTSGPYIDESYPERFAYWVDNDGDGKISSPRECVTSDLRAKMTDSVYFPLRVVNGAGSKVAFAVTKFVGWGKEEVIKFSEVTVKSDDEVVCYNLKVNSLENDLGRMYRMDVYLNGNNVRKTLFPVDSR